MFVLGSRCHFRNTNFVYLQVCPSLLIKKDRGRPTNPKARPKAFGEVNIASNVPGIELLHEDDDDECSDDASEIGSDFDDGNQTDEDVGATEEDANSIDDISDDDIDDDASEYESGNSAGEDYQNDNTNGLNFGTENEDDEISEDEDARDNGGIKDSKGKKRKFSDFDDQLNSANKSLRALKKLAVAKMEHSPANIDDGILSNEDFQRINEREVCFFFSVLNQAAFGAYSD